MNSLALHNNVKITPGYKTVKVKMLKVSQCVKSKSNDL